MSRLLWSIYVFMWLGGVISGGVSPKLPSVAPVFLVVAGALAVYENRAEWKALLAAALMGLAFELLGVHTGLPFGRYAYTFALAPAVFGVPLVIGFAWLILIDFVRATTASVLAGALLMAATDLVIDPLAAGPLHYWRWFGHGPYFGIPSLNFAGWIVASGVILAVLPRTKRKPALVGASVIGFFTVLAFEYRLWLPGLIGCLLIGAHGAISPWIRSRFENTARRDFDQHGRGAAVPP